tara:strand:- start:806 stop:1318 length:513 start_codon:yes stop_codon:yes gene_type:complete
MKGLEDLISTYKDFPKKGIYFKDVLGIIQDPDIFRELILKMSSSEIVKKSEAIISIDSRGFIFGSAIAFHASLPMITARKSGKLPGKIIEQKYNLEYGKDALSIQEKALGRFSSYVIVDDLIATGGTVDCVSRMLVSRGKKISGLLAVCEISSLKGRLRFDFPVETIISF